MWQEAAACKGIDTEYFFPEKLPGSKEKNLLARICGNCPVMYECRFAGLAEDEGIWGNSSTNERMKIRSLFKVGAQRDKYELLSAMRVEINKVLRKWRRDTDFRITLMEAGYSKRQIRMLYEPTYADRVTKRLFAEQDRRRERELRRVRQSPAA